MLPHEPTVSIVQITFGNISGTPVVSMMMGEFSFVMLTVKTAAVAAKLNERLRKDYNVNSLLGMAFNYGECKKASQLVAHKDTTMVGIYVPWRNFEGLKASFFNI